MNQADLEILLIAALAGAACALPGCLLVLRRMSLMSDAISHSILLGVALGFLAFPDLHSPWLMICAALTGLATVLLSELIVRTRQVKEDAAIGLVFPMFFSLGVIIITRIAGDVHLDVDAVLLGELAFAPFDRWLVGSLDLGPKALVTMLGCLILNAGFIALFYKELKVSTFDAALARGMGFAPVLLGYGLMALVSVTSVGAFDAAGSVLVVALFIAPPAAAYLLTDRLSHMLLIAAGLGVAAAAGGFYAAKALDASIAGCMALMCGVLFALALLLAPQRGLIARLVLRRLQRWDFASRVLTVHLLQHEGTPAESSENAVRHMGEGLSWSARFASAVIAAGLDEELIRREGELLVLTDLGRETARQTLGGT